MPLLYIDSPDRLAGAEGIYPASIFSLLMGDTYLNLDPEKVDQEVRKVEIIGWREKNHFTTEFVIKQMIVAFYRID
jgi:hypothetical protein